MDPSKEAPPGPDVRPTMLKRGFLIGLAIAFLIGLVPMWLLAHNRAAERDSAFRQIAAYRLTHVVASAALYAKRGEYEPARQRASAFFTELRSATDTSDTLTAGERDAIRPILSQRDE